MFECVYAVSKFPYLIDNIIEINWKDAVHDAINFDDSKINYTLFIIKKRYRMGRIIIIESLENRSKTTWTMEPCSHVR